jgi:DUF2075 family protein
MRLYSGMSAEFVRDTTHNRIAERLSEAFVNYYRYRPSPSEVGSWRNSLRAMSLIVADAKLDDHGIMLEYQLPMSSRRLDFLVCAADGVGREQAVIVELKQWESCEESEADDLVCAYLGGRMRDVLHPCVQVGQYRQYLQDNHTAFYDEVGAVGLEACCFLHNYSAAAQDALLAPKFTDVLREHKLFDASQSEALSAFLAERLSGGAGRRVLDKVEGGTARPSQKLMEHLSEAVRGHAPWVLLDEQLVVYQKIRSAVRRGLEDRRKRVIIVNGGPGTGKSVLAVNLVADFLRAGVNAQHATGSKAFTETIWKVLGNRAKGQFRYFHNYKEAPQDSIEVLMCDEAHRIRQTSNNRFTAAAAKSTRPQVEELLQAARTSVFFIDDQQVVRPGETGSTHYIIESALRLGCEVSRFELEVQFRCAGSEGFVNWVDNTLAIRPTANVLWTGEERFDFRILHSVQELESAIRARVDAGGTGRLVAGYCWPWSNPDNAGDLIADVQIGTWHRPWNARPEAAKLRKGIPRAPLWAYDAAGIDQVGCVYTAQGFEFDYVGVIWGADLVYRFDRQSWVGDRKASHDAVVKRAGDRFLELIKNTYRVLLSRGLKGCYVVFLDRETENFVRSRVEVRSASPMLKAAEREVTYEPPPTSSNG